VFFASPELLLDAKRAPRSVDLYAAAATLYYLLTAENPVALPTSGRQSAYLDAVRRNPRVPLRKRRPDVPEPIAATIDALVAIDASGRSSASPMDVSGLLRDTARRLDER
jgi:serine/threonine protein kinase